MCTVFVWKKATCRLLALGRQMIGQSWFTLMQCDDYNSTKIQSVWPHSMSETRIEIDKNCRFITELKLFEELLVGGVLTKAAFNSSAVSDKD